MSDLVKGCYTRMAYVSLKRSNGEWVNVGMDGRTVFKGSPMSILNRASKWAAGKPHRIEWVRPERPYGVPVNITIR